jgi:hypothetical protein
VEAAFEVVYVVLLIAAHYHSFLIRALGQIVSALLVACGVEDRIEQYSIV